MRNFKRSDRVRNRMLRDVRELLDHECSMNLTAMVTFTDVEMTDDLKYAKIFYSVLGNEEAKQEAGDYLNGIRKRAQGDLGRMLGIKFIPEITFEFDPSIEEGDRITRLINEISNENKNEPNKEA